MCLILVAHRACAEYPLVIASNRDEAYERPALPAAAWEDHPDVYGGRDIEAGGTWMGIRRNGRFAALTNFRQGGVRDPSLRTRGELVANYLVGNTPPSAYLQAVHRDDARYNGYSILAGDLDDLYFHSNRGNGVVAVTAGVHGLSNHLLNEPWPKVLNGTAALTGWLTRDVPTLMNALFGYLADRTMAPDHLLPATGIATERERELSAAFIASSAYGTRASSVIVVRADGQAYFGERGFGPQGVMLYENILRFRLNPEPARNRGTSPGAECPLP